MCYCQSKILSNHLNIAEGINQTLQGLPRACVTLVHVSQPLLYHTKNIVYDMYHDLIQELDFSLRHNCPSRWQKISNAEIL